MAENFIANNLKYEVLSKELIKKRLLADDVTDQSETFLTLYHEKCESLASEAAQLSKDADRKTYRSMELTFRKNVMNELFQQKRKQSEELQDILNEISATEANRNNLINKYGETVNSFEDKLRALDDEFNTENFKDELSNLANEKLVEQHIEETVKAIQSDMKRIEEIMGAKPDFDNLKEVQNKLKVSELGLEEKEKQLAMLKKAVAQLEAKVQDE